MFGKVESAVSDPEWAWRHVTTQSKIVSEMVADGRVREAALYAPTLLGESAPFERYLERQADENGRVRRTIHGHELLVDVDDEGLSQELLTAGTHEPTATRVFRSELKKLRDRLETVSVLEIGGNIGYYTILEADALGPDGKIYVCEPEPGNVSLLERNLERNGYADQVDLFQVGLSDTSGTAEFYLSSKSNCHSFEADSRHRDTQESIEVDIRTGDRFVEEHDIDPESINVIRMDVEGHEGKILDGLSTLLEADRPLLLNIELHSELIDNGELDDALRTIADGGLELGVAFNDHAVHGAENVCRDVDEIREGIRYGSYENIQAFFKKGY